MRAVAGGMLLLGLALAAGATARAQPIAGPQDAACRQEAKAQVFTAPDPQGLGPYAIGRQIYMTCMQRAAAPPRKRARRPRRS
ncbi:hypothetical protein [Methylobacterium sp. JK268]